MVKPLKKSSAHSPWLCRKTRSGFERLVFRLTASGCIDDKTNIACFAVFARRKNARSRTRRWSFQTEPIPNFLRPNDASESFGLVLDSAEVCASVAEGR